MSSNIPMPGGAYRANPPQPPISSSQSSSQSVSMTQAIDNFQPTVRVMRLYKPGFHLTSTMPIISHKEDVDLFNPSPSIIKVPSGVDNILSSHLLLPDNFGDIYLGEKFSAYISIVNGFPQVPFFNVTLSVKLQTSASVVDLFDVRAANPTSIDGHANSSPLASKSKLSCGESCEVLVQHNLNSLGLHTLRVTVNYQLQPGGEVKNLRKFYRFQVLKPLEVASTFKEINNLPMVQCLVTNETKSPIYIEEINFIPHNPNSTLVPLETSEDDIFLLQPNESLIFSFKFLTYEGFLGRLLGSPVIKWNNSLGESSYYQGEETTLKVSPNYLTTTNYNSNNLTTPIKFFLIQSPYKVKLYSEFEIVIKLHNSTSTSWPLKLDFPNHLGPEINTNNNISFSSTSSLLPSSSLNSTINSHDINLTSSSIMSSTTSTSLMSSDNPNGEDSNKIRNLTLTTSAYSNLFGETETQALYFTRVTSSLLGSLASNESIEVTITMFASSPGLHPIPPIYAVHPTTKERHAAPSLGHILVE